MSGCGTVNLESSVVEWRIELLPDLPPYRVKGHHGLDQHYICIHTHIHIKLYTYIKLNLTQKTHMNVSTSMYVYLYIYIYVYVYIHMCVQYLLDMFALRGTYPKAEARTFEGLGVPTERDAVMRALVKA